jgi:hypothetical protein
MYWHHSSQLLDTIIQHSWSNVMKMVDCDFEVGQVVQPVWVVPSDYGRPAYL